MGNKQATLRMFLLNLLSTGLLLTIAVFDASGGLQSQGNSTADSSVVTMRFGGDCLLAVHYESGVGDSIHHAFVDFDVFRTADIAMVNLECPVTTRGSRQKKPFTFRMHPRFLPALSRAGISIVNLANNHIYDFGPLGLFDTISYLDSAGIEYVGAGRDRSEAHRPVVRQIKGKRIGFLGYYGGGEAPAAGKNTPGVAHRSLSLMVNDILALRPKVDYIVVNLHWGTEKAEHPEQWQMEQARALIDAGADAIIGHHPHVLQGIERYKHGVVAYSLGNLIFGGNSRHTYDTAVFEISLGVEAYFRVIPIRVEEWRARELGGEEATRVIQRIAKLSSIFSNSIFSVQE
jgi:poly-gamma-glutamate capsule biosynthesis protein CapA/YwtB (metallophosphatase superfamily)